VEKKADDIIDMFEVQLEADGGGSTRHSCVEMSGLYCDGNNKAVGK